MGTRSQGELDELFEQARIIRPVSDMTRARALARARAALAEALAPEAEPVDRPLSGLRLALAIVVAFCLGATGAYAGLLGHVPPRGARRAPAHPRSAALYLP